MLVVLYFIQVLVFFASSVSPIPPAVFYLDGNLFIFTVFMISSLTKIPKL